MFQQYLKDSKDISDRVTNYIIDCDAGGDDAHALAIAYQLQAQNPQKINILGITAVRGNTTVPNIVENILITQAIAGVKIPVFPGCTQDILANAFHDNYFELDGLCGLQEQYKKSLGDKIDRSLIQKKHAVDFIIESILNSVDNNLCIICLGPLTNLAMAIRLNENILKYQPQIFVMGGAISAFGNTKNQVSEFNFLADVEAAYITVKSAWQNLFLLSWDVLIQYKLNTEDSRSVLYNKNDPKLQLSKDIYNLLKIKESKNKKDENNKDQEDEIVLCDQLCTLVAFYPNLAKFISYEALVALQGECRGQLVVNWNSKIEDIKGKIKILIEINMNTANELLKKLFE